MDSRAITTYLKGVAITTVILSHFGGYYGSEGFGILYNFVGLFFVLSGYGIYHSLQRVMAAPTGTPRAVVRFYVERWARIYPVYWVALVVARTFDPVAYPLGGLNLSTLGSLLASPFSANNGVFWFMTSVLQCYLLAPLIYLAVRRLPTWAYMGGLLVLIAVCLPVSYMISGSTAANSTYVDVWYYREMLLTHVWMFALGMALPGLDALARAIAGRGWLKAAGALTIPAFTLVAFIAQGPSEQIYMAVPFALLAAALCFYVISARLPLPAKRLFVIVGVLSFPLFLFHQEYLELLIRLGILQAHWLPGAVLTMALFPLLMLFCWMVDRLFARWRHAFTRAYLDTDQADSSTPARALDPVSSR